MLLDLKKVLLAGVLLFLFGLANGGPARALTSEGEITDDAITDEDTVEFDGIYDEANDYGSSGVLGRLWTGFSSRLNLFGSGEFEKKLQRFRSKVSQSLRENVNELSEIRKRQKRSHPIDSILSRDSKGFYKLSGLDSNVNEYLKTFTSPANAISMEVFEHLNFLIWLVTEDYSVENSGYLHVYMLDVAHNTLQKTQILTLGAKKCVPVLKLNVFIEIVCVETLSQDVPNSLRKGPGSGVYRITWLDGSNGLKVEFIRALKTQTAQDVALWVIGDSTFIAFANSYDPLRGSGELMSDVYQLQITTQNGVIYPSYDRLDNARFSTKYAYGLESFKIISRQFLAVANHKDDIGNVEIDSVIYVYDLHGKTLNPFQRIRTSGARDWAAFSFTEGASSEYFLAVANEYKIDKSGNKDFEVDSVIYKYDNGKFVPFQCIKTNGARQWIVYQGSQGEFLLGVVNGQSGVIFYQYNGWRFVQTSYSVSGLGAVSASFSYLSITLNKVLLTVANPFDLTANRPLTYYVSFEYQNPLAKYYDDALAWCRSLSNTIANDGLSDLVRRVQQATKIDGPRNFTTAVTIRGNLKVTAQFTNIFNIVVLSQGLRFDLGIQALTDLQAKLEEARQRLNLVKLLLQDAKKINSQTDLDGVRFSKIKIICSAGGSNSCFVNNLIANTVNGISASFEDVIRIGQEYNLQSLKLTDIAITQGGQITVDFISGPGLPRTPFSEIVTLTGNHNIIGQKTFGKLQANFLIVSGTVGGVRVSRDNLLLSVTEQRITTEVTFQSLRAESIKLKNINGRDFSSLLNNLVLKGATQTFTGPLIINGDLIAPSIITVNPVTPLDPVTASKTVLLHNTGETQIITGSHTVNELHALQGITVEGLLNGLSVPDDFYLRNSNEIINRPVTFQDVVADMVTIGSKLGDVQVLNGELDLLLLNGDQVVSGQKTFNEITLLGHSTVAGTISGYRLEDFTSNLSADFIRGINSGQRIVGTVTFENGLTVLDDLLDGVSISRILNRAIPLNASRIDNEVIFEGPVQIDGDLTVTERLNGVNIGDYVLKDGTHALTGNIIFTADLVAKDNVEADTVNGYDLSSLASRLLLIDGDQTITGDITFHSPEFFDLSVSGEVVVNGVNLNDVVTANSNAVITGKKTFTTLRVLSSVKAGAVDVGQFGQVDGVVISDLFFADSLRKTATSVQHLVGRELNVLIAESVSGTNLASLLRRVIFKDRPSSINGSLTFTGPVTVRDLTFSGTFDGVSAEDYSSGWLLKTGTQTLTGLNTFFNLNSGDVTYTGSSIQGVDLNQLLKNTAKIDEPTTLGGITFDEIISTSPVTLDGKIQGIKLSDEALLSNGVNQVVTGRKTFRGKVSYSGSFTIDGRVLVRDNPDDVPVSIDVGGLCNSVVSGSDINLQEVTVDGDVIFGGNVNISGLINDQSVLDLANTYWLSDTPNFIPSVTRFAEVEILQNANLNLQGLLNGVDIRALWDDLLRKECDQQTVTGEYFIENLTVDSLETDRITNSDDNLRLNSLNDVLLKDGDQRITGVFTFSKLETRGSVILDGTLNNLRVDTDFAQYNKPATITARKTFESLTIRGDLIVEDGVTIQGVDVSELVKNAVRPDSVGGGNCFIPGTTTFKGLRFEDGSLEVGGTVDGVTLNASRVLLKSVDQQILGRVVFSAQNGLEILDNLQVLDGRFNEIDLARLRDLTVRNNGPIVINGAVTFATSATFTTVIISNHLINGYNITDLGLCLSGRHVVNNMGDQFAFVLKAAHDARDMLSEKATELWYFIETDLTPVDKLMPVSLGTSFLSSHKFDTLAGLDLRADLVYTYRIERNFPLAFTPIPVVKPAAVAGLSRNLLATCGRGQMPAIQSGYTSTSYFNKIPLENGELHSFGHIYSVGGGNVVEAAFGINHCYDLVSFRLNDGRLCLAVIDHAASSTIICRNAANRFSLMNYLGTKGAVKGAWMDLGYRTYLLIVEEPTGYATGHLKVFTHDPSLDKMVLVTKVQVPGADDVDVIIQGMGAVIAVTKREQKLLHSTVTILTAYIENQILQIETLQTLHIREVHHCSFSLMPSGEVGLFIQTFYGIKLYLWKCVEFVYAREIKTEAAVWPTSEAFLYEHDNVTSLLVVFSASGALDPLTKEHDFDIVKTKLYTARYRGSKVVIPRYLQ
ncbi:uncharacterized protein clos [Palaemon carinicauda]|uniref:uncharacterized protein clos n=1 Tax=Palaemon carinicauda TaxID=392227 RepID=UPI0035B67362